MTLPKKLAFALLPALFLLVSLETALRLTGAAQTCFNLYDKSAMWTCDPVLFFKLRPTLVVNGKPLNSAGFRSAEFNPAPSTAIRVLSLGDSCTFGLIGGEQMQYIAEPYPQKLEELARQRLGPGRLQVLNAGVPAYNSFHGVMLLRSKLRGLKPHVVTVRYGWNDHFVSQVDPGTFQEIAHPGLRAMEDLLLRTEMYPFARRLGLSIQYRARAVAGTPLTARFPTEWKPTVSLEDYKGNLRRIVELGRAEGAEVWLLTSPLSDDINDSTLPDPESNRWNVRNILTWNAIPNFKRLAEIHESYNQASRDVAADVGTPLVDMAKAYQASRRTLFSAADVCHPMQAGHDLEAEVLYRKLSEGGYFGPAS